MSLNPLSRAVSLACSFVLLVGLQACTTITPGAPFLERSYELGVESTIAPGENLFTVRSGTYYEASLFVGLIYGGSVTDKWEQDIEEHELLFEGADGNLLKCTYRNSRIPAVAISIPSRRNPNVRSPYFAVSGGTAENTLRPMTLETTGAGHRLSYAGVEFEILELAPRKIRFRIISDTFIDPPEPNEEVSDSNQ